jgi:hypothetical protein
MNVFDQKAPGPWPRAFWFWGKVALPGARIFGAHFRGDAAAPAMPFSFAELRYRANDFAREHADCHDEIAESQLFWTCTTFPATACG